MSVVGLIAGVAAASIWGIVFVVPVWFGSLSVAAILVGRFLVFGIAAGGNLLLFHRRSSAALTAGTARRALVYSLASGIGMYLAIVLAVRLAGAITAAIVVGVLPAFIAWASFVTERRPFPHVLVAPSVLTIAGVLLTTWQDLATTPSLASPLEVAVGILCAVAALLLWTWFALDNARFLRAHPQVGPVFWANVIGFANVPIVLAFIPFALFVPSLELIPERLDDWLWSSLILGLVCSWGGLVLWNVATARIPQSVASYLIVLEPLVGTGFILHAQSRLPSLPMVVGVLLALAGVVSAIRAQQQGREFVSSPIKKMVAD